MPTGITYFPVRSTITFAKRKCHLGTTNYLLAAFSRTYLTHLFIHHELSTRIPCMTHYTVFTCSLSSSCPTIVINTPKDQSIGSQNNESTFAHTSKSWRKSPPLIKVAELSVMHVQSIARQAAPIPHRVHPCSGPVHIHSLPAFFLLSLALCVNPCVNSKPTEHAHFEISRGSQ